MCAPLCFNFVSSYSKAYELVRTGGSVCGLDTCMHEKTDP